MAAKWLIGVSLAAGVLDLGIINLVLAPRLDEPSVLVSNGESTMAAAQTDVASLPHPPRDARAASGGDAPDHSGAASSSERASAGSNDSEHEQRSVPRRCLETVVRFPMSSTVLSQRAMRSLESAAVALRDHPKRRVVLRGHTDETGPFGENEQLSRARALAVMTFLAREHGVESSRMRVESLGESEPLRPGHAPEDWKLNRRVEVCWERKGVE